MNAIELLKKRVPPFSWVHPALLIADSQIEGKGIFTKEDLPENTIIIKWGGVIFTETEISLGLAKQHTFVGIADGHYLAAPAGHDCSLDDYMNHSCAPNAGMLDEITIITRRKVLIGEELTADYAIWLDKPDYKMKKICSCGASCCRNTITGLDWTKTAVQLANKGYFSPFIAKRISQLNN